MLIKEFMITTCMMLCKQVQMKSFNRGITACQEHNKLAGITGVYPKTLRAFHPCGYCGRPCNNQL